MQSDRPLWTPSREFIDQTPMKAFIDWCEQRFSKSFADYDAFHDWSISEPADFWTAVWDHCGVIGEKGERALIHGDRMLEARFFPTRRSISRKTCCGIREAETHWSSGARTRRNRACPLMNCGRWCPGCNRP